MQCDTVKPITFPSPQVCMKLLQSHLSNTLLQKAHWLNNLNQQLLLILPMEFDGHVKVAGVHRSLLILEADSPVWATKIRFLSYEITKQLSVKTDLKLKSIKVNIQPNASLRKKPIRKKPYISKYSAHQLESLADSIKYPRLQEALAKLAKRYRK